MTDTTIGGGFDDLLTESLIEEGALMHCERPDGEKLYLGENGRFTTTKNDLPVQLRMRSVECAAYKAYQDRINRENANRAVGQRGNASKANRQLVESIVQNRDPVRFSILCAAFVNVDRPGEQRPPQDSLADFADRSPGTRHIARQGLDFAADESNYGDTTTGTLTDQRGNDAPST